jgi:predicted porin
MKKNNLYLALFGVLGYSLPAFAQSSVTLYGIIDDSIFYARNVNGAGARLSTPVL